MAYFDMYGKAQGEFYHKQTRAVFEYRNTDDAWAIKNGLQSEIAVGNEIRFATILRTVAYVAIDEDETGKPVLEKWPINKTWSHDDAK